MVKIEEKEFDIVLFIIRPDTTVDKLLILLEEFYIRKSCSSRTISLLLDARLGTSSYDNFADYEKINNLTINFATKFDYIKTALLVSSPIQVAAAMYFADKKATPNIYREVFSTMEAATAWLKESI